MSDPFAEPGRNGVSHAAVGSGLSRPALTGTHGSPRPFASATGLLVESPSLLSCSGEGPAFEMKFLLDAGQAGRVETWAADHMPPDAHADPVLGNGYRILSLYLDTPALDVYH